MLKSLRFSNSPLRGKLSPMWPTVVLVTLCSGCLVPASRMESCQVRYHQLSEKNKALQTQVANLEAACQKLQSERDQTEQELVFLNKEVPILYAKQRQLAQPPAETGNQLTALAADTKGLEFDKASGAVSLKPDIFFRSGTALKTESGEPLGSLATIFNTPSLQGHRLLIVTRDSSAHADPTHQKNLQRALTLQEFFRGWGIQKNRLGISNYGYMSRDSESATPAESLSIADTGQMKIFLLKQDVPVIGWDTSHGPRYR
ncbi:MAG: hypothetical protein VXZ84_00470 [Planctomycetota bacterium]|nr:hypothetical protein [Planctomycetota bacterium]